MNNIFTEKKKDCLSLIHIFASKFIQLDLIHNHKNK